MATRWCYGGPMKNINLRLDDKLHARVKAQADHDHRSLNQEIIWLLERGLTEILGKQEK
jgi:predicted HicB family RNase H-like nuclease